MACLNSCVVCRPECFSYHRVSFKMQIRIMNNWCKSKTILKLQFIYSKTQIKNVYKKMQNFKCFFFSKKEKIFYREVFFRIFPPKLATNSGNTTNSCNNSTLSLTLEFFKFKSTTRFWTANHYIILNDTQYSRFKHEILSYKSFFSSN